MIHESVSYRDVVGNTAEFLVNSGTDVKTATVNQKVYRGDHAGYIFTYNSLIFEDDSVTHDNPQLVYDLIEEPGLKISTFYPNYDDPQSPEVFRGGKYLWFRAQYSIEAATGDAILCFNPTFQLTWVVNGPDTACDNPFDCFSMEITCPTFKPSTKTIEAWSKRVQDDDRCQVTGITHYRIDDSEDRLKHEIIVNLKFKLFRANDPVRVIVNYNGHHWFNELPSLIHFGDSDRPDDPPPDETSVSRSNSESFELLP